MINKKTAQNGLVLETLIFCLFITNDEVHNLLKDIFVQKE